MFDRCWRSCGAGGFGQLTAYAAAWLIGVEAKDVPFVADLFGTKLVANEFLAYSNFKDHVAGLTPQAPILCYLRLDGLRQSLGSIGIQLGGIGAMAHDTAHRPALASGGKALFVGFVPLE